LLLHVHLLIHILLIFLHLKLHLQLLISHLLRLDSIIPFLLRQFLRWNLTCCSFLFSDIWLRWNHTVISWIRLVLLIHWWHSIHIWTSHHRILRRVTRVIIKLVGVFNDLIAISISPRTSIIVKRRSSTTTTALMRSTSVRWSTEATLEPWSRWTCWRLSWSHFFFKHRFCLIAIFLRLSYNNKNFSGIFRSILILEYLASCPSLRTNLLESRSLFSNDKTSKISWDFHFNSSFIWSNSSLFAFLLVFDIFNNLSDLVHRFSRSLNYEVLMFWAQIPGGFVLHVDTICTGSIPNLLYGFTFST